MPACALRETFASNFSLSPLSRLRLRRSARARCQPAPATSSYALQTEDYDLHLCVADSAEYPTVLSALEREDTKLCTMTCSRDSACDLEQACHEFQYARCFPEPVDAGGSDAS